VSTHAVAISYNLPTGGWSAHQVLWSDPGRFNAYPTIVLARGVLKIYYLQWRSAAQDWTTAVELARTLTCG
jgi:hypothetical protein